jgi:hypothetical protein
MDIRRISILLAVVVFAFACAVESDVPKDLEQGADVVGSMLKPNHLSKSMFSAAFPKGKPSQFVSYFFSDMGAAEWPPREDSGEFHQDEIQAMKQAGEIMMPARVAFIPLKPSPGKGKQIVIKYDDGKGVVITEGYIDPSQKPVLVKEWVLPKVAALPGVEEIYQSNAQLGMSDQTF